MAFREKSAWVTLLLTLAIYGAYFVFYCRGLASGRPFDMTGGMSLAVVLLVILQIAVMIVISALAPRDAQAPEDERERLIQMGAKANAYLALQIGAVAAAASVYLVQRVDTHLGAQGVAASAGGWVIANAVFGALAVAQLVQYASIILGYRGAYD